LEKGYRVRRVGAHLNVPLEALGIKYLPKLYQVRRRLMNHNTSMKARKPMN
jgi:hypothetical protein